MKSFYRAVCIFAPVLALSLLAVSARAQSVSITSPSEGVLFQHNMGVADVAVSASASGLPSGGGVEFVLDMGKAKEISIKTYSGSYRTVFSSVYLGEHTLDAFAIDASGTRMLGHDRLDHVGIGELIVTIGDTVASGDGDNIAEDDWSADGRNGPRREGAGGGYQPVLNNLMSKLQGYPHSVVNRGARGERISSGSARVGDVIDEFPEARTWLITYGASDIAAGTDSMVFQSHMRNIIQQIHDANPNARVYLSRAIYSDSSLYHAYHDRLGELTRSMPGTFWGADLETLFQSNHDRYSHSAGENGTWLVPGNPHLPNGTGFQKVAMLWKLALVDRAVRVCDGSVSSVGDMYADNINISGLDGLGLSEKNLLLACRRPFIIPPAPAGTAFVSKSSYAIKLTGELDFKGGSAQVTVREYESAVFSAGPGTGGMAWITMKGYGPSVFAAGPSVTSWNQVWLAKGSTLLQVVRSPQPGTEKCCDLLASIDGPGQIALVADAGPPVTSYTITPSVPDGTPYGWYSTRPKITLSASDIGGFAVLDTRYRWDGGAEMPYTGPVEAPSGVHRLYFHSVDTAGNVEAEKSVEIKCGSASAVKILSPDSNAIFQQNMGQASIPVSYQVEGNSAGVSVQLVLDRGTPRERSVIIRKPYGTYTFPWVLAGEHTIDAYLLGRASVRTEVCDSRARVGVGDIIVTVGDSITYGEDDDIHTDDWSADGRNGPVVDEFGTSYGGFQPILNDMLTKAYGYPHSVINRGMSRGRATDAAARIDSLLMEFPTAKTWIIAFGTNDSNHDISAESFKSSMQYVVDRIHAAIPGSKVYLPKVFYWTKPLVAEYHDGMGDIIRSTPGTYWGADLDTIFRGNHDIFHHRDYNTEQGTWFSTPETHHPNGIGIQKMALLWKLALVDRAILVADGNEHSMGDTWADRIKVDGLRGIGLSQNNLFMICEKPHANPPAPAGYRFAEPWSVDARLTGGTDFNGNSLRVTIRAEGNTSGQNSSPDMKWLALGSSLLFTDRAANSKDQRYEDLRSYIDGPGQIAAVKKE